MKKNENRKPIIVLKNIVEDEKGAVLILVLIVLVAAIILGVIITRDSTIEARIAGNERRYLNNFADLESAVNLILVENTQSIISVSDNVGSSFTTVGGASTGPGSQMPAGTSVTVTLTKIGTPQVGSGNGTTLKARYYSIQATDSTDSQRLTVGAYIVLPEVNTVDIN